MKTGMTDRTTVLAAVAAARMNLEEAEKFMNYVRMHPTEESLINLQKISYVKEIISRVPGGNPSLTYTWLGEETVREIGPGGIHLNRSASKAKDFKVTAMKAVGLTVVYETAQTDHVNPIGITVKKLQEHQRASGHDVPFGRYSGSHLGSDHHQRRHGQLLQAHRLPACRIKGH